MYFICESQWTPDNGPISYAAKEPHKKQRQRTQFTDNLWSDVKWDVIRIAFHPKVFSCQITNLLMGFFSGHKNVTPPSYE